ncbi:transcription factor grauzone-like [Uranotaenia lowii]|uniref:transcription factor grauzone-like n=1 Tax=Uranotaenia lowii TaxID=190385 RepID=UPI002478CCBB|nr:transcription factor grauzone-like [Uranotaenia lowii]XP_055597846.1 transcription factor grauzone-like [Uranotaenia lowii]
MEKIEVNCDFCFQYEQTGQISSIEDVTSAVRSIIENHFWFPANEINNLHICPVCHGRLIDFNDFYCQVERVYKLRLKKIATENGSTNAIDDEVHEIITADILEVKLETPPRKFSDDESDGANDKEFINESSEKESKNKSTTRYNRDTSKRTRKRNAVSDEEVLLFCKFECHVCSENFNTFNRLMRHCKEDHSQQGYVVCCNQEFNQVRRLKYHMRTHINPEAFQCSECKKNFASKESLQQHKISIHAPLDERQYECDICLKKFATRNFLTAHRLIHESKKFPCEICNKNFTTKGSLKIHLKTIHEISPGFMCDICSKLFKTKSKLKTHINAHLAKHEDNQRLPCTICGQFMKNNNCMKKHMKRHMEASMTITCDICGKRSPTTRALKKHIQEQHIDQPTHQCTMCDKSFKRPIALREHMATHTGEMLYSCEFCDEKFNNSGNISSHRKKVHPQEWQEYQRRKPIFSGNPKVSQE